MLVLLIIFMVAAPMLQRGVEVSLPVARRSPEIASERLFIDVLDALKAAGVENAGIVTEFPREP